MKVIKYERTMKVRNLEALPHGTGAKYLECIAGHNGELIAKCWRNEKPKSFEVLIRFK